MISVRSEGKIFGSQSWCTNLAVFSNLRVNNLGFALKSFKTVNSSVGPLKLIFPSTLVQEILLLVSTSLSTMQNDWQGNFDFRSRRHHLVNTQTLQFIYNIPPFFPQPGNSGSSKWTSVWISTEGISFAKRGWQVWSHIFFFTCFHFASLWIIWSQ